MLTIVVIIHSRLAIELCLVLPKVAHDVRVGEVGASVNHADSDTLQGT